MRSLLVLALVLAACAGDAPPDNGKPSVCTGKVYDNCITEHDCPSSICRVFNADGFSICAPTCDASTPCPMQGDLAVSCDQGVCKPAAPNDCAVEQ